MTMTDPGVALEHAPVHSLTGPPSPEQAREAMETYQAISNALIDPAKDIQVFKTRKGTSSFPKRSAFAKLANAYRVSTQIVRQEHEYGDDGVIVRSRAVVRATHPDGRYSEGDGACSIIEERFERNREKVDHDLPATAVTRAKNRAISDLIAFGAVSAEEAEAGGTDGSEDPGRKSLPSWAEPMNDVGGVAANLTRVLKAAGVENAAEQVSQIGNDIFKRADGGFPFIAARVVHLLAEAVDSPAEDVTATVEPEGQMTAEATRAEADDNSKEDAA